LTGIGIGIAVEVALHLDVIALKIVTRMRMTPALAAELKIARAKVASKTLTGRMSKAFGRMGMLARAKMGLRWGKTAAQAGETVASTTTRAGAEAVALSADNGARIVATRIAEREAARGALMAVSSVFDVAAIAGLALDLTNTGNYTELVSTGDMRTMKAANDSEVVNTTIACSTWPIGAGCPQSPSPAPAPAPGPAPPPREGRYPMFVGPLDAWDADVFDLALSNEFVRLFTSSNPPQSVKDLIADVSSRISTDLGVDGISDTLFIMLCNQYLSPTELENIHNLSFDNICTTEGGAAFVPGNGYDKACSYAKKDDCHAAFPWPPPNNDNQDLTYTEWRAKPWFSQWNTITPANIPTDGACIAADPSIHQMCDEEIGTASGRATNQYIRETGECVNTRDVCRVKGVSYRDSDPPTCYVTEGQEIAELLFGSTIVRFIISGGKLSLDPDLITTVVSVTIPSVNSGNSTVDTAVNTVSSGLASAAAEISNAGIEAANAIQSGLVLVTNETVNAVAAIIRDGGGVAGMANESGGFLASVAQLGGVGGAAGFPTQFPNGQCPSKTKNLSGVCCWDCGNPYSAYTGISAETKQVIGVCNYSNWKCGPGDTPTTTCPLGTTLMSDNKTCCPSGYTFTGVEGKCCPAGQSLAPDNQTCCPTNTFFSGVTGKCCPTGTTFSATSGQCECPPNSVYDTSANDCRCAPGFIKSTDGSSCVALTCTGRTQIQI
jgi:hypothetical protein